MLLIIIIIPPVHSLSAPSAEIGMLEPSQMPEASYDELSLDIEFEVENTGFEKVLITLPSDFTTLHSDNIDNAYGETIITRRLSINEKYGDPDDPTSFRNRHFVMTSASGYPISRGSSVVYTELGESKRGWYARPNERLKGHIKIVSTGNGIIDPFLLEKDLPYIKVTRFSVIIKIEPKVNNYGFIAAPYVVKNATLVSTYPMIYGDANDFDETEYYWEALKFPKTETTREINVVDWDDWFTSSTLPLTSKLLSSTKLEYYPIEEVERKVDEDTVFTPVWFVQAGTGVIRYEYEYRKNFEISGVNLDLIKEAPRVAGPVPEWYLWF